MEPTQKVITTDQLIGLQQLGRRRVRRPRPDRVRREGGGRHPRRPAPSVCRTSPRYITYGASPRASINLILAAKALALAPRARLRPAPGRPRPRPRRAAPPRRALLRGAHRRRHLRRRRRPASWRPCPLPRCPSVNADHGSTMPSSAPPATPERVLRRLEWRVIRRLDGRLQGDYRTLLHGVGIDLADLRDYEPGDDVRHIDWNVTARMDAPVRAHLPRGPRADGLAAARPLAVDGLRSARPARRSWC